jgi:hypothetical protein
MKKILLFATIISVLFSSNGFAEQSTEKIDFSMQQWYKNGSFDYYLHYSNSSQVLSKVSAPQRQNMTIFKMQYNPTEKQFVRVQYGATGAGNNGRGYDLDWSIPGSSNVTDYGTMDFYGKEKMYTIDLGTEIGKSKKQVTNFFVGWGSNKTYNELRNVVYHKYNGFDIGNVGQDDNGSSLEGHFYGIRFGIESNYKFDKKLSLDSSLILKRLNAKAYGHWANHTPAWNWVDTGKTWGYDVNFGLKYNCNKDTFTSIGYYYSHAKANNIDERLDEGTSVYDLTGRIDLEYVQHGYYFALNHKF